MGVVRGHWDRSKLDLDFAEDDGDHPLNMGVALVTPAQCLESLLMDETERNERRRKDREDGTA